MKKGPIILLTTVFILAFFPSAILGLAYSSPVIAYLGQTTSDLRDQTLGVEPSTTSDLVGEMAEVLTRVHEEKNLQPGTNHNRLAGTYAYSAEQVQRWMNQGSNAADFPAGKKLCFLTFDDGPSQEITPRILDVLESKNAHGTFFIVGPEINEDNRPIINRQLLEGHALALHTWSHDYHTLYPRHVGNVNAITTDYMHLINHLQTFLGADFKTGAFRYPGGHMSWKGLASSDQWMLEHGYHWIDWNVSTADAAPGGTQAQHLIANVQRQVKPEQVCAVILMHDSEDKNQTVEALPAIIDHMKALGFEFAIIS